MHEYILSNHDRKNTYYFAAIVSTVLGGLISYLVGKINVFTGLMLVAPSGMAVFCLVFLVFDNFIWRIPKLYEWGLVKIPNINGRWEAELKTVAKDESIKAEVIIHQTYTKIKIRLETDKSSSLSRMAAMEMADPSCFVLRYEYLSEFRKDVSTVLRHHGVTELRLTAKGARFRGEHSARYYTEMKRDTHGEIFIKWVKKNER